MHIGIDTHSNARQPMRWFGAHPMSINPASEVDCIMNIVTLHSVIQGLVETKGQTNKSLFSCLLKLRLAIGDYYIHPKLSQMAKTDWSAKETETLIITWPWVKPNRAEWPETGSPLTVHTPCVKRVPPHPCCLLL